MGMNDKIAADKAAVDAMRLILNTIDMDGIIIIGEGERTALRCYLTGEAWDRQAT